MAIPDYHQLMQPALRALAEAGDDTEIEPLMDDLADRLGLSADMVSERLPSGRQTVFANRLQWALAYLQSTGLVSETNGAYRPTPAGCDRAGKSQPTADKPEQPASREVPAAQPRFATSRLDGVLASAFADLQAQLRRDLLARIHEMRPALFERLVIDLLVAMGYGRSRSDLACYLGRRGDGGIDGAVRQDTLGLDVVYVQAKRYRPGALVPAGAVRDFAGSLDAVKARKGVFVTSACFPKSAGRFVNAVPSRIVLIDGQGLADLLVQHDIAVRSRGTYDVKVIDESYFAAHQHLPDLAAYPSKPPANGRRLL